jgi:hypothetical protein
MQLISGAQNGRRTRTCRFPEVFGEADSRRLARYGLTREAADPGREEPLLQRRPAPSTSEVRHAERQSDDPPQQGDPPGARDRMRAGSDRCRSHLGRWRSEAVSRAHRAHDLSLRRALLTTSCTHAVEMAALLLRHPTRPRGVAALLHVRQQGERVRSLRGRGAVFIGIRPDTLTPWRVGRQPPRTRPPASLVRSDLDGFNLPEPAASRGTRFRKAD